MLTNGDERVVDLRTIAQLVNEAIFTLDFLAVDEGGSPGGFLCVGIEEEFEEVLGDEGLEGRDGCSERDTTREDLTLFVEDD